MTGVASGNSFEKNSKTTPEFARRNIRLLGCLLINLQLTSSIKAKNNGYLSPHGLVLK
jgi:hypothetical protein